MLQRIGWVVMLAAVIPTTSLAQGPAPGAAQNVEVDPVTCWWRTTSSSVRMGEPFSWC